MQRIRPVLRFVAAFFLLNILTQVLYPSVSYALTSGPTAPEANTFEPFDTTDMVNLATGDFTYSLPLLEVPGPAGGYPLSLSYHAGITPGMEASWVGLGWNLNPGAINRSVNGIADDHDQAEGSRTDFWEGGQKTTGTVGISYGIANTPATVSFGLEIAHDTYQGFGVGHFQKIGMSTGLGNTSLSAKTGVSPYGGSYYSVGAGASLGTSSKVGLSLGVGSSVAFTSNGFVYGGGVGVSYANLNGNGTSYSLLGASISSSGGSGGASISVGGGGSSASNANMGKLSTSTSSFDIDIPIGPAVNLSLGYSKTRYWIHETTSNYSSGVLYGSSSGYHKLKRPEGSDPNRSINDWHAHDTYSLLDKDDFAKKHPVAEHAATGTFADHDHFRVSAQGMAGYIRPYTYSNKLKYQNISNNGVKQLENIDIRGFSEGRAGFRFMNDFSNDHVYTTDPDLYVFRSTVDVFEINKGVTKSTLKKGGRVPGSKHIEYFTYSDIIDRGTGGIEADAISKGFIESNTSGYNRGYFKDLTEGYKTDYERIPKASNIGAFTITNTSGVRYHYSLPVYSYDEVVVSENLEKIRSKDGHYFTRVNKKAPYAYTWLLTAITGPDYVDRNTNGKVDKEDWGYWVEFDYGLWHEAYRWRNPGVGFHLDEDNNFRNFSTGLKEIYYLDAVRTATHTAYFVKEKRDDAKSGVFVYRDTYSKTVLNSWIGSYNANVQTANYVVFDYTTGESYSAPYNFQSRPVSQLKLKKIILTNHSGASDDIKRQSNTYDYDHSIKGTPSEPQIQILDIPLYNKTNTQTAKNILDVGDLIGDYSQLEQNALNVIELDYEVNNPLMPKTPNSFDNALIQGETPSTVTYAALRGKLTLKQVLFKGKGGKGAGIIPPITFDYGQNDPNQNPQYSSDKTDIWGMYKSDFDMTRTGTNDQSARVVTEASAAKLSSWSLKKINTSVGATVEVDFEPDDYRQPVYLTRWLSAVSRIDALINDEVKLKIDDLSQLKDCIFEGRSVQITWRGIRYPVGSNPCDYPLSDVGVYDKNVNYWATAAVEKVDLANSSITIKHSSMWNTLTQEIPLSDIEPNKRYKVIPVIANIRLIDPAASIKGGGIRVKSIRVSDNSTNSYSQTNYGYRDINNSVVSSGVTSYEPTGLVVVKKLENYTCDNFKAPHTYKAILYENYDKIMQASRILPAPGVIYEYVTVKEQTGSLDNAGKILTTNNFPGSTIHNFHIFKKEMVGWYSSNQNYSQQKFNGNLLVDAVSKLHDWSNKVGSLKKITTYDTQGRKLSETRNHYSDEELPETDRYGNWKKLFGGQGIIEEMNYNARQILREDNNREVIAIVSHRTEYPVVQTGMTNINYRTGISSTTKTLGFDFLSGEVTNSVTEDNLGNRFLTKIVPAYQARKHDGSTVYTQMGHKLNNPANKHMLSQVAETYVYKVDEDHNKLGLVSANVQTWSNNRMVLMPAPKFYDRWGYQNDVAQNSSIGNVYRKESSYLWQPTNAANADGTYSVKSTDPNHFISFDWSKYSANPAEVQNADWVKTSEIMRYNIFSKALEVKDMNNTYAATRLMNEGSKVLASAANSSYNQFAVLAEELPRSGNNGWSYMSVWMYEGKAHSGSKSFAISPTTTGMSFNQAATDPAQKYQLMFWADKDFFTSGGKVEVDVNGHKKNVDLTTKRELVAQSGNHYLFKLVLEKLEGSSFNVSISNPSSATLYLDDIRIHPINAAVTAYVYDEKTDELTHILNGNNFFTRYEYDVMGKLKSVYVEKPGTGERLVAEHQYNYAKKATNSSVILNFSLNSSTRVLTASVSGNTEPVQYFWYTGSSVTGPWAAVGSSMGLNGTFTIQASCQQQYVKCLVQDNYGRSGERTYTASVPQNSVTGSYSSSKLLTTVSGSLTGLDPYTVVINKVSPTGTRMNVCELTEWKESTYTCEVPVLTCGEGYEVVMIDKCKRTSTRSIVDNEVLTVAVFQTLPSSTYKYTLTAIAEPGTCSPFSYAWRKSGSSTVLSTSSSYVVSGSPCGVNYTYTCVVTDASGRAELASTIVYGKCKEGPSPIMIE